MLHLKETRSGQTGCNFKNQFRYNMKRSIYFFPTLFLLIVNAGLAQTVSSSSNEDHNAYPLIIALIMLVVAIATRLITVSQSHKRSNTI